MASQNSSVTTSTEAMHKDPRILHRIGRKVVSAFGKVFPLVRNVSSKLEQDKDEEYQPNRPIIITNASESQGQKRVSSVPNNMTRCNKVTVMAPDEAQSEPATDSHSCKSKEIVPQMCESSSSISMTTLKQAQTEVTPQPSPRKSINVNVACGTHNIAEVKATGALSLNASYTETFPALTLGIVGAPKTVSSEITVTTIAHNRLYTRIELAFMAFMRVPGQNIFRSVSFMYLDPASAFWSRAIQSLLQRPLALSFNLNASEITKRLGQFRTDISSQTKPEKATEDQAFVLFGPAHVRHSRSTSDAHSSSSDISTTSNIGPSTYPTSPDSASSKGVEHPDLEVLKKLSIFAGRPEEVICHSYPPNGFIVHPKDYFAYEEESRLRAKFANEGRGRKTDKEGEYPPEYLKGMIGTNAGDVFVAPPNGRCEVGECTHVRNPCYPERKNFNVDTIVRLSTISAMSNDQFGKLMRLSAAQQAANIRMHSKGIIHALVDIDGPSGMIIYPPYNEIEILGQHVLEPRVLPPSATIPVADEWQHPYELDLARFLPDCRVVLHFSNPMVNVMLDYRIQDIIRPDVENVDGLTALAYLDNGRRKNRAEAYYRAPYTRHYRASGMLGQVVRMQVTNTLTNDLRALCAPPDLEPDEWSMQRIGNKSTEMYRVIPKNMVEVQPWSHVLMLGGRVDTNWNVHTGFENSGANERQFTWEKLKTFAHNTEPELAFDVVKLYCSYTGEPESSWLRARDDPYQFPPEILKALGMTVSGDDDESGTGNSGTQEPQIPNEGTEDEESDEWASTIAFSSDSDLSKDYRRSTGPGSHDGQAADAADLAWFDQKVAELGAIIDGTTNKFNAHIAKQNDDGDLDEDDGPDLGYDDDSCVSDGGYGHCQACLMKLGARKNLAGINDWLDDIEEYRASCWQEGVPHDEKKEGKEETAVEVDEAPLDWHNILVRDTLYNLKTREQGGLVRWHKTWLSIASEPIERVSAALQLPEHGSCTIIADAMSSVHNLELHYAVETRLLVLAADRISYFDIVQDGSSGQEEEKLQKALEDGWWQPNLEAVGIPCTMLSRLPITWVLVDSAPSWCKPGFNLGPQQSWKVDPGFCSPR